MGRMIAAGAAAVAAGLLAPVPAAGAGPAEFDFKFTTDRVGATAGMNFHIVYRRPEDPEGKAPALKEAAFALPAGTRIDNGAVPKCTATDEEFRARGRDACPAEANIGDGSLVATTGTPGDPVRTDVTVFNGDGEIVELVTFEGTNTMAGLDRLTVEGSTLRAHPPATPGGPPDGRTTIREIRIAIAARRGLVTTPGSCPSGGAWRAVGTFAFEGYPETSVPSTTPCRGGAPSAAPPPEVVPGAAGAAPALRVRVSPRRVRAGRRSRVRIVVSGPCASGATVRIGRSRARTDTRGRATLRVRIRRSAAVRVTRPGCRAVRARLRAIR